MDCPSQVLFHAPFGALVCGPTMSGKTVFVKNLIKNRDKLIDQKIPRVVYCYGEWQDGFEELRDSVEFHRGLDKVFGSDTFFNSSIPTLLILDDLGQELANHPRASKLFTQGIHHRNVSAVLLMQNMYTQGRSMRNIQLNCQYMVLFRNARDINQIGTLARQTGLTHLPQAYEHVTSTPYTPIIIDLRPNTPDYLRLRAIIPSQDQFVHIYLKASTKPPCQITSGNSHR